MPVLLPIILTASHVPAVDTVPKFSVERTCRPAAVASILPGRDASACQRDESDVRRSTCAELRRIADLQMAKQAKELPVESTMGAVTDRR
jgi:hypothetical protein